MVATSTHPDCSMILGPGVLGGAEPIRGGWGALFPEESAVMARAVESRRAEFGAGRALARRLLAQLGVATGPLLPGEGRSPQWPRGFTGSIAHCADLCIAVVARAGEARSLGIDIEHKRPLEAETLNEVCAPEDLASLRGASPDTQAWGATAIFCAKEAVFKALFPITGAWLEFRDVRITLDLLGGSFRAVISHERVPADLAKLEGVLRVDADWIIAAVRIAPGAGEGA